MSLLAWAWASEHEQGSRTKSFLKYSSHVYKIFKKYSVTLRKKYLVTWKNILPCVTDEFYLWMKNDNGWTFFMNICNKFCFAKSWTKETRYNKFMLVYCEQFVTWNVQVILELVFHIPTLQHPNHIKFEITSNSMAHKPIDPPKNMRQFK